MKINGVVVLYNPEKSILENIHSYIDELEVLYIVDNSESKNNDLILELKKINKCQYIDNEGNKGIAHALNVGAKLAIENDADWLLTMDQDSKFMDDSLNILLNYIKQNICKDIGILSPFHNITNNSNLAHETVEVDTVMTSGNLLNLKAYIEIGGFLEKLFIDYVDNEYCLRLKVNDFKILQVENVFLKHSLGAMKSKKLFGKTIYYTNHNYMRRYYITRNSLYVWNIYQKEFANYVKNDKKRNFINIVKILFLEKEKYIKFRSILCGIIDFYKNTFGKFNA